MKTNAARILDSLGIRYELREYEVDPDDLSAETVAAKIGMPLDQVWKTLVARGDRNGVCLAVVPASAQLDLKSLARLTGDRKVDTVPLKEVQPLTGYVRGGVTASRLQEELSRLRRRNDRAVRSRRRFGGCSRHPALDRSGGLPARHRCDGRLHHRLISAPSDPAAMRAALSRLHVRDFHSSRPSIDHATLSLRNE